MLCSLCGVCVGAGPHSKVLEIEQCKNRKQYGSVPEACSQFWGSAQEQVHSGLFLGPGPGSNLHQLSCFYMIFCDVPCYWQVLQDRIILGYRINLSQDRARGPSQHPRTDQMAAKKLQKLTKWTTNNCDKSGRKTDKKTVLRRHGKGTPF